METSTILMLLLFAVLQDPVVSNKTCRVTDDSVEKHQKMFRQLVSDKMNDMIYIYLEAPEIYKIRDNEFDENRMTEWIWVTAEYQNFLRYPLDFDIYTFGLLRRNIKTLHLQIDVDNVLMCKHSSHTDFLYGYLTKVVNGTDNGMICHRYFHDQQWKSFLFNISHVSIGYDFECFPDEEGVNKREIITKSPIIYIMIIIVLLVISFYPGIISFAIHEEKEHQQVMVYTKADYPYTLGRFLLYILFHKTSHSFISIFRLTFLLVLFGSIFYSIKLIVTHLCENCLPTDKRRYPRVFDLSTGELEDNVVEFILYSITFLACLLVWNAGILKYMKMEDHIILLDITNFLFYPSITTRSSYFGVLKILSIKDFGKQSHHGESVFSQIVLRFKLIGSIYFWSKLFLFPMRNFTEIQSLTYRLIYVLVSCVISLINIFVFLICTLSPLMNLLYHQSVHLYGTVFYRCFSIVKPGFAIEREDFAIERVDVLVKSMFLVIFLVYMAIQVSLLILVLYLVLVNNCFVYGFLYFLQTLIYSIFAALPHLFFTQIHIFSIIFVGITYILYFIVSFHQRYRKFLCYLLKLRNTSDINVIQFEKIVSRFFPLRNAVFTLLAKSLFTVLILAILFITFQYVHLLENKRDTDFDTLFPIIASLFAPGIIEKYCFKSIEDELHRKENDIKELLSETVDIENNGGNEHANIPIRPCCPNAENRSCFGIPCRDIETPQEQMIYESKYVFPCIRCKSGRENHSCENETNKTYCQIFYEEMCSCITLECTNEDTEHAKHCNCCYTIVENYHSAEYELLPNDDPVCLEDDIQS